MGETEINEHKSYIIFHNVILYLEPRLIIRSKINWKICNKSLCKELILFWCVILKVNEPWLNWWTMSGGGILILVGINPPLPNQDVYFHSSISLYSFRSNKMKQSIRGLVACGIVAHYCSPFLFAIHNVLCLLILNDAVPNVVLYPFARNLNYFT